MAKRHSHHTDKSILDFQKLNLTMYFAFIDTLLSCVCNKVLQKVIKYILLRLSYSKTCTENSYTLISALIVYFVV